MQTGADPAGRRSTQLIDLWTVSCLNVPTPNVKRPHDVRVSSSVFHLFPNRKQLGVHCTETERGKESGTWRCPIINLEGKAANQRRRVKDQLLLELVPMDQNKSKTSDVRVLRVSTLISLSSLYDKSSEPWEASQRKSQRSFDRFSLLFHLLLYRSYTEPYSNRTVVNFFRTAFSAFRLHVSWF